jgi:hypothetical protein
VNAAPEIPGHEMTSVLGTGGFAVVYRGWPRAVGREVAVKVDNRVLFDERDRRRFFREVTAAGRLSGHPHVVDVYDAGMLADGRPYLVMELCPGGSLNDELRRHGPMSAQRVTWIGVRLADALAAAHAAGVLHRDIKPANVLVNRYGVIGLADFGLASIIAAGGEQTVTRDALTPAFAPPESFRRADPTAAADIYSLAATLYMLLAGRPPRFPAGQPAPGLAAIVSLHSQPVADVPGAPPGLMAILRQGLDPDPARRPPTAAALRDALAAQSAPADAQPAPAPAAPPPGWGTGVPATGDYASAAGYSRGGGHGTEGTAPSRAGVVQAGPATQPPGRRRSAALAAAAGGGLVLVVAALLAGAHFFGSGGAPRASGTRAAQADGTRTGAAGTGAAPGVFGVATVTSGCPAASAGASGARCPSSPECWAGIVEISGNASAQPVPCTASHVWETFAIGILPADVSTFDAETVAASPTVRAVCSAAVLLRSRAGAARQVPAAAWDIQVLPPDEAAFDSGARAYRCLAHVLTGPDPVTSQFLR